MPTRSPARIASQRAYRQKPEVKAAVAARLRERYATDPKFRAAQIARVTKNYQRLRKEALAYRAAQTAA